MSPEAMLFGVLSLSFSLNVVFMRRLLAKLDRMATEMYNPKEGVLIRLERLERDGGGVTAPENAIASLARHHTLRDR